MRTPEVYLADSLKGWDATVRIGGSKWVMARPLSYGGLRLFHRFRLAWRVFIGECDALRWVEEKKVRRG